MNDKSTMADPACDLYHSRGELSFIASHFTLETCDEIQQVDQNCGEFISYDFRTVKAHNNIPLSFSAV